MMQQEKALAAARELRRATEDILLACMRTELAVIRTLCFLAQQEDRERRAHRVTQAEALFELVLKNAKRVAPNQRDCCDIEEARHNIRQLGGRDFWQPHTYIPLNAQ
jgi:hypothetical protein